MQKTTIRYSEAFKCQVVEQLRKGKFQSLAEAKERYGIGGHVTIRRWIKKYGDEKMLPRKVRIEMPEERDQIKKLKKEKKELMYALSKAKVKEALSEAYFEELCEELGIEDIEEVKKKLNAKLLDE
jgi:transposase-like protein